VSREFERETWFRPRPGFPERPLALIATEGDLPEPDPDEELLLRALEAAGLEPRLAAWDDPRVDWGAGRLTVIRSTWNYYRARDAFVAWAEATARRTALWNPATVVRWNSHKSYLRLLDAEGIPVVPTVHLFQGDKTRLQDLLAAMGWRRAVIKPAVSASSYRTLLVNEWDLDAGEGHLRTLAAAGDVLVQPYLESVEDYGERAVIWIDGEFTHAVRKSPRFDEGEESVSGALAIGGDERRVAEQALAYVDEPLLYARVDLARDEGGQPLLMELELIEPSLFLRQHPPALERLVAAIVARVRGR